MSKSLEEMTFDSGYAHGFKVGWEQAKREAMRLYDNTPTSCSCNQADYLADQIRDMEYKEPTNE